MTLRRALLFYIAVPLACLLSVAHANMPGTYMPLASGLSCLGGTMSTGTNGKTCLLYTSPSPRDS